MPATIGGLQRVGFEGQERHPDDKSFIFGQYSRVYRYQDDARQRLPGVV